VLCVRSTASSPGPNPKDAARFVRLTVTAEAVLVCASPEAHIAEVRFRKMRLILDLASEEHRHRCRQSSPSARRSPEPAAATTQRRTAIGRGAACCAQHRLLRLAVPSARPEPVEGRAASSAATCRDLHYLLEREIQRLVDEGVVD
jgi:hypothetical protein